MKRVLLATTALGMSAGVAIADVTLSGAADMGIAGSKDDSVRFHTDIDVTFTLSGETDGGVTFGSAIDIDEASDDLKKNAAGTQTVDHATQKDDEHGGIAVFIEDADGFGKLTLGDANGAVAAVVSDARGAGPGSIGDNHEHGGSSGNDGLDGKHDGQILLWERAIGSGFSAAASVELSDDIDGKPGGNTHDPIIGIGGKYSMAMGMGTLGLGLGYQMGSFDHAIGKSVGETRREAGLTGTAALPGTTLTAAQAKTVTDAKVAPLWGRATGVTTGHDGEVEGTVVAGSVSLDFGNGGDGIKIVADASVMEADGDHRASATAPVRSADVEATHIGLGLGYTVGAISVGINVGSNVTESTYDPNGAVANDQTVIEKTVNGVGFSAAYDLGGGAELQFGIGSSETENDYAYGGGASGNFGTGATSSSITDDTSSDTNSWSLGVAFKF